MKKTRTIEMIYNCAHYRGVHRGYVTTSIRDHFKLPYSGKVRITIKEEGPYRFTPRYRSSMIEIHKDSSYVGIICGEEFERLFFKPDGDKGYSIAMKKVR